MSVLDRLRRQLEKYREMIAVVGAQRTVFASMDVDAILGLIERKRAILAEVQQDIQTAQSNKVDTTPTIILTHRLKQYRQEQATKVLATKVDDQL